MGKAGRNNQLGIQVLGLVSVYAAQVRRFMQPVTNYQALHYNFSVTLFGWFCWGRTIVESVMCRHHRGGHFALAAG